MDELPEKFNKYSNVRVNYRIWINAEGGESVLDDEKWQLLQAIDANGSLVAAAEKLGISYRKAWGDMRNAEEILGFCLIEKQRGGAHGGTTTLTEEGKRFVKNYEQFHQEFQEAVNEVIIRLKKRLKQGDVPSGL